MRSNSQSGWKMRRLVGNFVTELLLTAGSSGKDFHRKCDDVGPTVTLVKCGTNVFGGYTDQSWKPSGIRNIFYIYSRDFKIYMILN